MKQRVTLKAGAILLATCVLGACSAIQTGTEVVTMGKAVTADDKSGWAVPDWSGIWITEGLMSEISGFPAGDGDYLNQFKLVGATAPWNETGLVRFGTMLEITSAGDAKAKGWGYPMMMAGSAPLQFLITPQETLIINMYRDTRHVFTDGREHPPEIDRWTTTWGESVGYWDGDTLVIDTVSVRKPTEFFWFSPPFSEQARYVERLRMTAPDRIESQITIDDPLTLREPWVVHIAYEKTPGLDRLIHDDYTNDRSELDENNVFSIAQ